MNGKVDLNRIKQDAEQTAAESTDNVSEKLVQRLDEVDLLIADLGQVKKMTDSLANHADEVRTDVKWNRLARLFVLLASAAVVIGLAYAFNYILTSVSFDGLRKNPAAFSTVTVACIGGIIITTITVTKSVFMSFDERNKGIPMPEHIKAIIEPIKELISGKN